MSIGDISPVIIGLAGIVLFLILMGFGMPVGFSMLFIGIFGFAILMSINAAFSKAALIPFRTAVSYDYIVIPLFTFMAYIAESAELSKDLFDLAYKWLGFLRGGLAMASIGACAVFSAVCSSSIATAVTVGLVAIPEMKKHHYAPSLATGCVAAGGTLGILIPPSSAFILYGVLTQQSIGKLFIAGIVPGILLASLFIFSIAVMCRLNPKLAPSGPATSLKEKLKPFGRCGEIIALIILVLGGLFFGWFTPTEAGAVGAFGAVVLSLFRKRLSWQKFKSACVNTALSTGMVFAMLIGALMMSYFLSVSTIPAKLAEVATSLAFSKYAVIAFILIIYMILGCFISSIAMVLLTIPIFYPLVLASGFDPIWFGVIIVIMMEMAAITPPVGINVFTIAGIAKDVSMPTIFKGIAPFCLMMIIMVVLLIIWPQIATFLPSVMS